MVLLTICDDQYFFKKRRDIRCATVEPLSGTESKQNNQEMHLFYLTQEAGYKRGNKRNTLESRFVKLKFKDLGRSFPSQALWG